MSFKFSKTAEQACGQKVQCDGKSTNAALQAQAPENRGVCLRDLKPEQRGVHYPHSTTTERLDSILHPSAAHALCGECAEP